MNRTENTSGTRIDTLTLAACYAYDPTPTRSAGFLRFRCPLHGGDKQRSFHVEEDTGKFGCHNCPAFGTLEEHQSRTRSGQQSSPPNGWGGQQRRDPRSTGWGGKPARTETSPTPAVPLLAEPHAVSRAESAAHAFESSAARAYARSRGVADETALRLGLGFWRGVWQGVESEWLTFPLCCPLTGAIVGVYGRNLHTDKQSEKGRVLGPKGLFGGLKRGALPEDVILVEGPFDALACLQSSGLPAAYALCGTSARPEWFDNCGRVVLLLDDDAAGQEAAKKLAGEMQRRRSQRGTGPCVLKMPPGELARRYDVKDLGELLARGETFNLALPGSSASAFLHSSNEVDTFALSGRAWPIFSEHLQEAVWLAAENANVPDDGRVVYRASEMQELLDINPAGLRFYHEVKRIFGGELLAGENPAPVAGPGPTLAAVPEITPAGDLFTASPSALLLDDNSPLENTALLDDTAPVQLADAPDQQGGQQQSSDGDALPTLHLSPCADPANANAAPDQNGQHEATESEAAEQAAPIRARKPYGGLKHWRTAYIDTVTGDGVDDDGQAVHLGERPALAAILAYALHSETRKVFLCGPIPAAPPYKPGTQAAFDAWAMAADAGGKWQDGDGKRTSHLGNVQSGAALSEAFPVIRKQHRDTRADCVLYRMAAWLGEGDYTPAAARIAMLDLAAMLWRHFGERVELTSTPAHTGQELWKLCTRGREYPTLPDDLQALIKSTSGQGRIEFCAAPGVATIPGFVYLDARFAYAASLQNLPAGLPVHDDLPDFVPNTRGRYRVRYEVPAGWDHIGLLMTPRGGSDSEWEYPAAPGQIGETWAGWTEIHLAQKQGWKVQILERLLFPQAAGMAGDKTGPLDTWGRRLTAAYDEAGAGGQQLVKKALRSILLFGVGTFARSERPRRVVVPISDIELLPADNPTVHKNKDTGNFEYWASDPVPASRRRLQHPEWAAEVWARARTRMLLYEQKRGRGEVVASWGALAAPRESVIAIRTDALYLSCDPGWPDAGRPGDMRVKGQIAGPLAAPRSFSDLNKLREKSEKMHKQAEQQQSKQQKGGGNGE